MNDVLQLGPDTLVVTILALEEMIKGDDARGDKGGYDMHQVYQERG